MMLKLMYITNRESIAKIAQDSGVDWIFIDLEKNGKKERQGHLDTVISNHCIEDVKRIRKVLNRAKLIVRINPMFDGSKAEIDRVIQDGADIVMLPFFKSGNEVEAFIRIVDGRAKTCLLFETREAVESVDDILALEGIDLIHIGMNDLHLALNRKFLFELLADGTVDRLCKSFKAKGIPYGFGGIARPGQGAIPAENIIAEHYRLGSSMVILSRSFYHPNDTDSLEEMEKIFKDGVAKIRAYEEMLAHRTDVFFEQNRALVIDQVRKITGSET